MKKDDRFQKNMTISNALQGFIKANNLDKGLDKVDAQDAWFAVMGQAIEAYTDGVELKKDVLIVRLSSSTLREELSYGKEKIVKNINEYLRREIVKQILLV